MSITGLAAVDWWTKILGSAPQLKRLSWNGLQPNWDHISWENLTHMKFSFELLPEQVFYVLSYVTHLVYGEFILKDFEYDLADFDMPPFGAFFPPPINAFANAANNPLELNRENPFPEKTLSDSEVLTHTSLSSLSIHGPHNLLSTFFAHITLPHLTHLVITQNNRGASTWPQEVFMNFLQRSSCTLLNLSLWNTTISQQELLEWLKDPSVRTSLVELWIKDWGASSPVSDEVLRALTAEPSDSETTSLLVPNLEYVKLGGCMEHYTDGLLADMVKSRYRTQSSGPAWKGKGKLRKVEVEILSCYKKDIRRLERLKKRGLDVEVAVERGFSDEEDEEEDGERADESEGWSE